MFDKVRRKDVERIKVLGGRHHGMWLLFVWRNLGGEGWVYSDYYRHKPSRKEFAKLANIAFKNVAAS